jgi:hypothetical protein
MDEKKIEKNEQKRYTIHCTIVNVFRTGQDRTGQDKAGQDRTGQDKAGQHTTQVHITAHYAAPRHSPVDSAGGRQGQRVRPFGAARTGDYSEILPVHS